jgi:MICOS complex subunit MIC60
MLTKAYQFVINNFNGTPPSEPTKSAKPTPESKSKEQKPVTFKVLNKTTTKVEPEGMLTVPEDVKAETVVKAVEEYPDLVQRAEAAIAGKPYTPAAEPVSTTEVPASESKTKIYDIPLPLGFEPPPGYSRPPKLKAKENPDQPVVFPLVAPALASASEPIITHLARTIDNLATYLKSDPKAAEQAIDVLELAKSDLAALVERIEAVKAQERTTLEAKMDEQSREYTLKLMELEMEGQDKLDYQEQQFRTFFEQERARFIQAYREKLDHELRVQTELINERYVTVS